MRRLLPLLAILVVIPQGPPSTGPLPVTITIDGRLTHADYERMIEHPFDVPAGTRRVDVALTFTGAERRTVIDLGLRGPEGLRGWSGGRTSHVSVSRLSATPGYLPGPVIEGRWAVLLGVPNIRAESGDTYSVTVTLDSNDLAPFSTVITREAGWYVGDLHAHSGHSDGRTQSQTEGAAPAAVSQVLDAASAAGLDFVALTDHNTASHWLDIDRLQPLYSRVLLLHGREITTYRGHANTVGERAFTDFRLSAPTASPADVLEPINQAGAFVSINHPTAPDDERCMGCGWNVVDARVQGSVHGVEVINGDSRAGPLFGWPFWAGLLNRGWRLTAVGGSDEHTPDERSDRALGTPATVVWARELSEHAIVDGLKSGRVYVRTRGVDGLALELEGQVGDTTHQMGSTIMTAAPISLRLRVTLNDSDENDATVFSSGGSLDPPASGVVEWIRNGEIFASTPAIQGVQEQSITASPGDWFSIVVRQDDEPTLISNAIYVRSNARQ